MSNLPLFLAGCFITALVLFGVGGLIYAAILDGRYDEEMAARRDAEDQED